MICLVVVAARLILRPAIMHERFAGKAGPGRLKAQVIANRLDERLAFPDRIQPILRVAHFRRLFLPGHLAQLDIVSHRHSTCNISETLCLLLLVETRKSPIPFSARTASPSHGLAR